MTTPTGTISISQVNTELGRGSTANVNIGLAAVRTLAGVPSGSISMSQLRGKSNSIANGTMNAGSFGSGSNVTVGYVSGQIGALTNSNSSNPITAFSYNNLSNLTQVQGAGSGTVAFTSNPSTMVMTMNGVTATLTFSQNGAIGFYQTTGGQGNVFNIVNGGSYSWSYK